MSHIPEYLNEVGQGWHPILLDLHAQIVAVCPDYVVGQVKEKFGGLRVYLDHRNAEQIGYPKQVWDAIHTAEALSMRICEDCGAAGTIGPRRPGGVWVKALCDGCRKGA